jgi:hypothetical protein
MGDQPQSQVVTARSPISLHRTLLARILYWTHPKGGMILCGYKSRALPNPTQQRHPHTPFLAGATLSQMPFPISL